MPTPLDSPPSPEEIVETDASGDPALDLPARSVPMMYLKVLAATVALLILGSPTLARLGGIVTFGTQYGLQVVLFGTTLALISSTLVLIPLAAKRLRRQGRDISRSYGVAAILATASGLGFAVLQNLWTVVMILYGRRWDSQFWLYYLDDAVRPAVEYAAVAITAAWMILAVTGVGRSPSQGLERIGLGLGLLWILAYIGRWIQTIAPVFL
jgi:hypothetical protein